MNFKQSRIQSKESYGGHYVKIHHYKGKNSPRRQNNPIYIYMFNNRASAEWQISKIGLSKIYSVYITQNELKHSGYFMKMNNCILLIILY